MCGVGHHHGCDSVLLDVCLCVCVCVRVCACVRACCARIGQHLMCDMNRPCKQTSEVLAKKPST